MYIRITRFKMKPDHTDAVMDQVNAMKDRIMGMPGMLHFTAAMNGDGSGYIVAYVKDKATSDGNAEKVQAIWGAMADHLEGAPVPEGFDVVADWSP